MAETIEDRNEPITNNNEMSIKDLCVEIVRSVEKICTIEESNSQLKIHLDASVSREAQLNREKNELEQENANLKAQLTTKEDQLSQAVANNSQVDDHRQQADRPHLTGQLNGEKHNADLLAQLEAKETELVAAHAELDAARQLIRAVAGINYDLDVTDSMIELQRQTASLYDTPGATGFVLTRSMPRMIFEQESYPILDPVSHAIKFWIAMQSDRVSFVDSQALFNADIIDSNLAVVYSWVFHALTLSVLRMEHTYWPASLSTFNKILTVLQGVAWLSYTAQTMSIPFDDVQELYRKIESYLTPSLGRGSVLGPILDSVKLSFEGQRIVTWSGATNSESDGKKVNPTNIDTNNRVEDLNVENANRYIVADTTSGNFALVDQAHDNHVLYTFSQEEVEAVEKQKDKSVYLVLHESFVSNRLHRRLLLLRNTRHGGHHVSHWIDRFTPGKLRV
ncbi:MAG: hypothetical protein Q9186_002166 [Xanthomendoza sp. 1 TL-2023]